MEALAGRGRKARRRAENDVVLDVLKALQTEVEEGRSGPKEKSEALWQRFKDQGDRIYDKLRAGSEAERTANLAKKEALCQRVEALSSTLSPPAAPEGRSTSTGSRCRISSRRCRPVEDRRALPTREQGEALWTRFKGRRRSDPRRAEEALRRSRQRARRERQAQRGAVHPAESLQYSNDWKGHRRGDQRRCRATGKPMARPQRSERGAVAALPGRCDKFFERRGVVSPSGSGARRERQRKKMRAVPAGEGAGWQRRRRSGRRRV